MVFRTSKMRRVGTALFQKFDTLDHKAYHQQGYIYSCILGGVLYFIIVHPSIHWSKCYKTESELSIDLQETKKKENAARARNGEIKGAFVFDFRKSNVLLLFPHRSVVHVHVVQSKVYYRILGMRVRSSGFKEREHNATCWAHPLPTIHSAQWPRSTPKTLHTRN